MTRHPLFALPLLLPALASADVPTYHVEPVASFTTTTTLTGCNELGVMVGWQVALGQPQAFVAALGDGLTILPLPPGYNAAAALGVNDHGVIVGAVSDAGAPFDLGEPAIWTPEAGGGYSVGVLAQLATAPGPFGNMPINGGLAVDINNAGQIVGWSRFQGFQGGPATLFAANGAPANLASLGFAATPTDISETGLVVGGGLRLDLSSGVVTALGVPDPLQPGDINFTNVIAYAINDWAEAVVAADLASVPTENYLTYMHNDADAFIRLNPSQLPSRFVGFYDNNNLGDVSASGGVLFRAEGALVGGYDALLDGASSHWDTDIGFINNDRSVCTTAINTSTGENALVILTPPPGAVCAGDVDSDNDTDVYDFGVFASNFGMSSGALRVHGDLTGDGAVDVLDFSELVADFGCN